MRPTRRTEAEPLLLHGFLRPVPALLPKMLLSGRMGWAVFALNRTQVRTDDEKCIGTLAILLNTDRD